MPCNEYRRGRFGELVPLKLFDQPLSLVRIRSIHILSMLPLHLAQNPEIVQGKQTPSDDHTSSSHSCSDPGRDAPFAVLLRVDVDEC